MKLKTLFLKFKKDFIVLRSKCYIKFKSKITPIYYFFLYEKNKKKINCTVIAFFVIVVFFMFRPKEKYNVHIHTSTEMLEKKQKYMYIIDVGHGHSKYNSNSIKDGDGRFYEWEYCFEISKLICAYLDERNILYMRTDEHPENSNMRISKRVKMINEIKKKVTPYEVVVISLHANFAKRKSASGFEILMNTRKCNNIDGDCKKTHKEIADFLQCGFETIVPEIPFRKSRKTKQNFLESNEAHVGEVDILKKTKCIAVLTENGFYSNPNERELMKKPDFQKKIAKIHINLIEYLEN
jgi:N-acetylmuramoyl-L-alanine amidase